MKNLKEIQGITLIALVITIIVLLILAGVSIATLTGENGILTQAETAKETTENKKVEEQNILTNYEDIITQYVGVDWNTVLENAQIHPDQKISTAIGVGTNGKAVNMDLWNYTLLNDGTYGLNTEEAYNNPEIGGNGTSNITSVGYIGNFSEEKIDGTIPQYISIDGGNSFAPVTDMYMTFVGCTSLTETPLIPSTVKSMFNTFVDCTELVSVLPLPDSIENMQATFARCSKLTVAPEIPPNVTNMQQTFLLTSISVSPNLPNKVENLQSTFQGTKLISAPKIPESVTNMKYSFYDCWSLTTASKIPSSAIDISFTYGNCPKLNGIIEIDANVDTTNPSTYNTCLQGSCTQNGLKLKVIGTSLGLNEIVFVTGNANISL